MHTWQNYEKKKKTLQEVLLLLTVSAVIMYIRIYICESEMQRMCEMTRCERVEKLIRMKKKCMYPHEPPSNSFKSA